MARKSGASGQTEAVVIGVEINARRRQIEVTTLQHGSGRHVHYPNFGQVPPELQGEALAVIRAALQGAGYASFAELDEALTRDLVVPAPEDADKPNA